MNSKRIYLKNPTRLIGSVTGIIILTIMIMIMFQGISYGENIPEYTTVVVSQGDTLWGIAKRYYGDNEDVREKIEEIKELNNIAQSYLQVGQRITLKVA